MIYQKGQNILCSENLFYDYTTEAETVHALQGVSCCFDSGKIYSITGRSGSGKTTFLSLLAGFDRPLSGNVLLCGKSIYEIGLENYRKNNIGMIFQSYYLIPQLTAIENVLLALEFSSIPKNKRLEKAIKNLCDVGITAEKHNKRVTHLSGGEQQRVAIARAIACEPSILLADEPTGNLDTENSNIIIDMLCQIAHDYNKCVIIVTHSNEIAATTDINYHMCDGRIIH